MVWAKKGFLDDDDLRCWSKVANKGLEFVFFITQSSGIPLEDGDAVWVVQHVLFKAVLSVSFSFSLSCRLLNAEYRVGPDVREACFFSSSSIRPMKLKRVFLLRTVVWLVLLITARTFIKTFPTIFRASPTAAWIGSWLIPVVSGDVWLSRVVSGSVWHAMFFFSVLV